MAEFIKGSVIIALLEMLCQPPSYPSFELRRLGQKGRTSPRSCMAVSHVMKKFKKSNNTFPQRRIDILAWFAQLFVGRRYISQRRAAHPHMHAVDLYKRLPPDVSTLASSVFHGKVLSRNQDRQQPCALSIKDVLANAKVNDEPFDECTRLARAVLEACQTAREREFKAYVKARTFSKELLQLEAMFKPWSNVDAGIELIIKESKNLLVDM